MRGSDFSFSYPTSYQMYAMFQEAVAFDQSLAAFNTAKVADVRLYTCLEPNRNERPDRF